MQLLPAQPSLLAAIVKIDKMLLLKRAIVSLVLHSITPTASSQSVIISLTFLFFSYFLIDLIKFIKLLCIKKIRYRIVCSLN
jgi:hypothetical protein